MPRFYDFMLAGWVLAVLPQLAAATAPPRASQPLNSACSGAGLHPGAARPATTSAHHLLAGMRGNCPLGELVRLSDRRQSSGGGTGARQVYQVRALLGGTGQGNFVAPATNPEPAVGQSPISMVMGDVDKDGDLDLLTANDRSGTVSVRLNDGQGNFTAPTTNPDPAVGRNPASVAIGDVDGDGDLDLLTANYSSHTVSVRLNDGRGSFSVPATNPELAVGYFPRSVAVGDVDGDGDLDLLTANFIFGGTVSVRLNDGRGNFSAPATNPEPTVGIYPVSVVMGDVDKDGDLDLLAANFHGNTEMTLDGTVSVRLNDGTGNFSAPAINPNPAVGIYPSSVVIGDLDGDGDLDLLAANSGSNTVSVRLNDGQGNFLTPATNPDPIVSRFLESITVGDVDGDGDLDLLAANAYSNTVSVRLNDGRGNFSSPPTNPDPAVGDAPYSVVVGDVDGDGDLDLLTANQDSNTVSVRLNQPAVPLPVRPAALAGALTLFPNPTHGSPTLRGAVPGAPVEVVDALGRPVLRTSADATGTATLVLPPGLTRGVYVVRTSQQALRVILD
jgi:hypothetical protein